MKNKHPKNRYIYHAPSSAGRPAGEEGRAPSRRPARKKSLWRQRMGHFLACLGVSLVCLAIFVFGGAAIINYGPSPSVRNLFVTSMMETSAAKFLASWYFSDEELESILQANSIQDTGAVTDGSLVEIPDQPPAEDQPPLQLEDVSGPTFKGKMLIVQDPSRVYLATSGSFGSGAEGKKVEQMMERDGAVAGVNAGGFVDENGVGNGGQPLGMVIAGGELLNGGLNTPSVIAGFDQDNKLIVGSLTGSEALEMGLRDAVSFGPVLIVNGERAQVEGTGGGLNPRTAIGQRADGAVLLLVIDGRQPHSIGATYKDLIDVMEEYGAVNACNMDGGSSSLMFYEGELVTTCASLYGSRKIPTAWLVK